MSSFVRPSSTTELAALAGDITLIAGGTDVLVQRRAGRSFATLVDVSNLTDAPAPVQRLDGVLKLSALASLGELIRGLGSELPALRSAIACFASEQIRNRATLGGNLANASPAADCVPPLVAAEAVLELRSTRGSRSVPIGEFAVGPRRTCLRPGEWIHTIDVPVGAGYDEGFRKVAGRRALAISVVSLAWRWARTADGRLTDVRLAAGAVAPTVRRYPRTEAVLENTQPDTTVIATAARTLAREISPIDDVRAGAEYRRAATAGVLTEVLSALTEAL